MLSTDFVDKVPLWKESKDRKNPRYKRIILNINIFFRVEVRVFGEVIHRDVD